MRSNCLLASLAADPLVETASLASVPLPAPTFEHNLHDCVAERLLSDAQLETIVSRCAGCLLSCWSETIATLPL